VRAELILHKNNHILEEMRTTPKAKCRNLKEQFTNHIDMMSTFAFLNDIYIRNY